MIDFTAVRFPFPGCRYRHYKGGVYFVYGYARDSDFKNKISVLYTSIDRQIPWHRELYDWCEMVKWPDGVYRQRFSQEDATLAAIKYPERKEDD